MADICLQKKRGVDFILDQTALWECAAARGRVLRVDQDDIDDSKNGTHEPCKGDG